MSPLWIVIPTLDRHEALAKQLGLLVEEAAKLRGRQAVIVVSDDGSDPPVSLPEEIVKDAPVRLLRSDLTRGPNVARDWAIRVSPERAVVVELDDHDYVEPGALGAIDRVFRRGAWVACGDFVRTNSRGEAAPCHARVSKGPYRRYRFRDDGALHVGMRAYRRELYDAVGGYRTDEFPAGDYALMLRMEDRLKGRRIVHVPRVLCRVVTSARGISVRLADVQRRRALEYRRRIIPISDSEFREPDPPDFSRVTERYAWLGREGGGEVLLDREARLAAGEELSARKCSAPLTLSDRKCSPTLTLSDRKSPVVSRPSISAIVPLFRSARYVKRCLTTLLQSLPPGSEIIAVDDGSPDRSGEIAREVLAPHEAALVVRLSENTGFAHAVNAGARLARGEHLLLFNADAVAKRGFVEPMLRLLEESPDVAIVGNRHVKTGGAVDSEGSEFCWRTRAYRHVGRDMRDPFEEARRAAGRTGSRVSEIGGAGRTAEPLVTGGRAAVSIAGARSERGEAEDSLRGRAAVSMERDMVTFACALVRRSAWLALGGLDERFRKAYFEDSDLCMRARVRGWRVLYTPEHASEIVHVGRHSRAGSHPHYRQNARLFEKRWVRTGLVDRFRSERGLPAHEGRVVVCMIACSEEEFVGASLESVYRLADRIVIVEGGTRYAVEAGLSDELGRSTDRTVAEVESFVRDRDAGGKIELVRAPGRPWRDKREMRDEYAKRLSPGDWMLLLDADEVFTEGGLWRMSALMHAADVVCPSFSLFWNDMSTLGTGRWDDYRQVKAVRWRGEFSYSRDHNCPTDARGTHVTALGGVKVARTRERLYFHYSWAGRSDEKLRMKCRYYVAQNRAEGREPFPADYFERVFLAWRASPREIEKLCGTHPYGGGGTRPFGGRHPEAVRERMNVNHPLR